MPPVHYHEGRFPPRNLDLAALMPLAGPTTAAIARYDGRLSVSPNSSILLAPLREREGVMSSRIEGTRATVGDVLLFEAGNRPPSERARDDIVEVVNYRKAMAAAETMLEKLPLCQRVARAAHRVLMSGARGEQHAPGQYRRSQNWIGPPGCDIARASFIPVSAEKLPAAMGAWEKYIHDGDAPDLLIQAAILHAEFEALHPFWDGNGRMGRMLIPLFLWQRGLIHRPIFYLSARLEARREEYYRRLLAVSRDDDWTGWCRFFLESARAQAEEHLAQTAKIFALYEKMKGAPEIARSHSGMRALDWIFQRPIFRNADFAARAGMAPLTARRFIAALTERGVLTLRAPARGRRSAILAFPELLAIADS